MTSTERLNRLLSVEGYEGILRLLAEKAIADAGNDKSNVEKWVKLVVAIETAAGAALILES